MENAIEKLYFWVNELILYFYKCRTEKKHIVEEGFYSVQCPFGVPLDSKKENTSIMWKQWALNSTSKYLLGGVTRLTWLLIKTFYTLKLQSCICVTHFLASTQFNCFPQTGNKHDRVSACLECCTAWKEGALYSRWWEEVSQSSGECLACSVLMNTTILLDLSWLKPIL